MIAVISGLGALRFPHEMHGQTPDERCAAVAATQFGIVGDDQLLDAGLSKEARYRRLRAGKLSLILPGAYRMPGIPPSWKGDLLAACLSAGPDAIVSHRSAASLYGLDGVPDEILELSLRNGRRLPGVITHRLRPSDRPAIRHIGPFTVSAPERTLLDLAAVLPPRQAGLAIDDALRKKMTTLDRLIEQLHLVEQKGRTGVARFRKLLGIRDARDAKLRSSFEAKMLRIVKRVDPAIDVDFHVRYGSLNYYLDFAYPAVKLGIECHSIRWHLGDESGKRDVIRDRHLSLMGWTILYFSWDDVAFTPKVVEDDIRRMLQRLSDPREQRFP